MRRKTFPVGILGRLIIALILALCLVPISSNPVAAQSLQEYFEYTPTVEFSKTQITGSEVFSATISVAATCKKNLPLLASEAEITGRIIATHQTNGANVTLNSGYTVNINPFPRQAGQTTLVNKTALLQFPSWSQFGTYSVVAELIEARVKVLIWLPVTNFVPPSSLPPPQTIGSVIYTSGVGGGGGGGGGGGVVEAPTTTVSISGLTSGTILKVDEGGIVQETGQLKTLDKKVSLDIAKGTKLLDTQGKALGSLLGTTVSSPPEPPPQGAIVYAYDFGPDGTTFAPPITLTITYDESLIPDGAAEENLVMAMWDGATGEWAVLVGSTVDLENNTITAPVSHFTTFAVLVSTGPAAFVAEGTPALVTGEPSITPAEAETKSPASFVVSGLSITPAEVDIGEGVIISTLITNTGDVAGSYKVTLRVDNVVAATEEITLEGDASEEVTFTIAKDVAGSYTVTVDGLSGTFVVRVPPEPINWWLLGGIMAVCIALVVVISLAVIHRRRV